MRSRAFVALFAATFVATLGISMVSPVLPVYAKDLGATGIWLGLIGSIFALVQAVVSPFVGRLSDRYGRKQFILAGLGVYILSAIGYFTAQTFWQVLVFRASTGLGAALTFSPSRAYVGELTPRGQEGRWLGIFAVADIVGFGTGPLIAGVIRQEFGFRAVFATMAVILVLAVAVVAMFVPGRSHGPGGALADGRAGAFAMSMRAAIRERLVLALAIQGGMLWVASGAIIGLLAIRLEDDLGVSPILIGVAFSMQSLTGGVAQPFWGRLADRANRRMLVALGLGACAAVVTLVGAVPAYWMALALLLVLGGAQAVAQISAQAIQVVAGRRVGMGTVQGITSAGQSLGFLLGALAGAMIYDAFSIQAAFVFAGSVMALGIPVFLWLTRGLRTSETLAPIPEPATP